MKFIRHGVAALAFFGICVVLFLGVYSGFKDSYGFTESGQHDGKNIMEALNEIDILGSLNKTTTAIVTLTSPDADALSKFDAIFQSALGIFGFIFDLIRLPGKVLFTIVVYYPIPSIIVTGVLILLVIYVAFIYYSKNLRQEL